MSITLREIMNLEIMQTAEVLTAEFKLKDRWVESVSVMEIPVEDFIEPYELVLSTAIGCGQQAEQLKLFVEEVYHSGASALAIATGRHIQHIPDTVLRYAEKLHFPIIEIPWEVRFSEIIEAILSELHRWQQQLLNQSEALQKQLLQHYLNGASLSIAAETMRKAIGRPIVILDHNQNIVGKSQRAQMLERQLRGFEHRTAELIEIREANVPRWIQRPIQSSSKMLGFLLAAATSDTNESITVMSKAEENLLEHALTAAALWFMRERTIQEVEVRLMEDFVWSLASGEIVSWEAAQIRAQSLHCDLSKPYVCMVGQPEPIEMAFRHTSPGRPITYHVWDEQTIQAIKGMAEKVGRTLNKDILMTYQEGRFIIFLETSLESIISGVHHFLDELEMQLKAEYPAILLSWGIGDNAAGERTFHESYTDAAMALNIGTYQQSPGHRSTYESTRLYRALLNLARTKEIRDITHSVLDILLEHDLHHGLDLVHTLNLFIRHKGNVSKTSRSLNLHRQSLLYRLRKIESLTERSLNDPNEFFLFDLCLKLWTLGLTQEQI